jgi:siroheme synthase-like protein
MREWVNDNLLDWMQERYQTDALFVYKPKIVFAATNDCELNDKITSDARKIGAWVNNASDSENSDFHTVATIEKYPIRVGISTNAKSPALTKVLKQRIEQTISDDIVQLATW